MENFKDKDSPSGPQGSKEKKTSNYLEKPGLRSIGKQYTVEMRIRDQLQKTLEKYNFLEYMQACDANIPEEKFHNLVKAWLTRARQETDFFAMIDDFGIEIFKDRLEDQPGFINKNIQIRFRAENIMAHNIRNLSSVAGTAGHYDHEVNIEDAKPPLTEQIKNFIVHGTLHQTVVVLIHELIHKYHQAKCSHDKLIARELTEAQAYFSDIYKKGAGFSLKSIAQKLIAPENRYDLDADTTNMALLSVAHLNALGLEPSMIGSLIAQSEYDFHEKKFVPMMSILEEIQHDKKLDEIGLQTLDDLYRLHFNNERMKAQLLLLETIDALFSKKELIDIRLQSLRSTISTPHYYNEGILVDPTKFKQHTYCPANKELPYDFNGKRTGIMFSYASSVDQQRRQIVFTIGRWEAEGKNSQTTIAKDDTEIEHYIHILEQQAPLIDINSKFLFLHDYAFTPLVDKQSQNLLLRVMRAIINPDEFKMIFKNAFGPQPISTATTAILEELEKLFDDLYETSVDDFGKIVMYQAYLQQMKKMAEMFAFPLEELDPVNSEHFEAALDLIDELKERFLA